MPNATVTVEFVNQPKEGKAFGSIKTKELGYVGMKPADLSKFTKGQTYEIEYKVSGDEGQWKNLVKVVSKPNGAAPAGGTHSPDNSRMIFITGIVGRAMGSGKYGPESIRELTMSAAGAYDALTTMKPKPAEPKRETYGDPRDLDDEIPF